MMKTEAPKPRKTQAQLIAARVKIHQLEEKVRSQRAHISRLEECRRFERRTEQLLAAALREIWEAEDLNTTMYSNSPAQRRAARALVEYTGRLGPRPTEQELRDAEPF